VLNQTYDTKMYTVNVRKVIEQKLDELYRNEKLIPESYFLPEPHNGCFSTLRSGKWFHEAFTEIKKKHSSISRVGLLSLIVYTDATAVGPFGNHHMKPIYMAFGNCSRYSNSISMIAFFPELKGTYSKTVEIPESKEAKRRLTNLTWKNVLEKMQLDEPIQAFGQTIFLKIAFVAGDHPEQQKTSFCLDSNRTRFPCRCCFVTRDNLNWLGQYPENFHPKLRTPITVFSLLAKQIQSLKKKTLKSYWETEIDEDGRKIVSMHPETPIWTTFRVFWETAGIYQHSPPCILHCLSLGIFKNVLQYCVDVVQNHGHKKDLDLSKNDCPPYCRENDDIKETSSPQEDLDDETEQFEAEPRPKSGAAYQRLFELDLRISSIPAFAEEIGEYKKRFKKGISSLTYLTGGEYDEAIRIIIFAIRDSTGFFMDEDTNIKIIECLLDLRELLVFVRKPHFSEDELRVFSTEFLPRLRKSLFSSFGVYQKSHWNLVKVHMLQHLPMFIRKFGCPGNFDTGYFEVFHKPLKKLWGLYQGEHWPMKVLKCMEFLRVQRADMYSPESTPECPQVLFKTSTRIDLQKTRQRYGKKYIDDILVQFAEQYPNLTVTSSSDSLKIHHCKKTAEQTNDRCRDNWIRSKWRSGYSDEDVSNLHSFMVSKRIGNEIKREFHRMSLVLVSHNQEWQEHIVIAGETFQVVHQKDPIMQCPKVQTMEQPTISFITMDCAIERVLVIDDFDWRRVQDQMEEAAKTIPKAGKKGKKGKKGETKNAEEKKEKKDPSEIVSKVAYVALFEF
jgi:hypothetical protein